MAVRRAAAESARDGWKALRICTGMTPLLQRRDKVADLLCAECENEQTVGGCDALMLCTLGRQGLSDGVMDLCIQAHSMIFDGGELRPNAAFADPPAFRRDLSSRLSELLESGELDVPFASLDFSDSIPVLKVTGEMDFYTAPMLEDLGTALSSVGQKRFVVDLSNAPFLDAAAIGTLLRLNKIARGNRGRLVVYDPQTPLRTIFRLVELNRVIPIRHDFDEALHRTGPR